MYFIFNYEVNESKSKVERDETIDIIQNAINDLNYISPFTGTVLIKCTSADERNRLLRSIRAYTDVHKDRLNFLISPIIHINKGFSGFISKDFHGRVTEITTNEGIAF